MEASNDRPNGDEAAREGRARARFRFYRELARAAVLIPRMTVAAPFQGRERARTRRLLTAGAIVSPEARQAANDDARRRFRAQLGVSRPQRVFVSCGEPSGESHARDFVHAYRSREPSACFKGFGGRELEEADVEVLVNLVDHAIMGFTAVLKQVPFFKDVVARFVEELVAWKPDIVVLVDYPGLHLILAEEAKRRGIPVLYYVCPQYWAWAPWRMKRFRRAVDGAIAILPFEPPLFENHGIPTAFAGSPLLASIPAPAPEPRDPLLAILPGSRSSEITRHLDPLLAIWRRFHAKNTDARAVLPQPDERRAQRVRDACARIESVHGTTPALEIVTGDACAVLARSRCALVKSGTSTLQTALCRTPQLVFYKTSGRSEIALAKGFLASGWIAAPNLVLGREAFPEVFFAGDRPWARLESQLEALWQDGPARAAQLKACDEVRRLVDGPGSTSEVVRWLLPDASAP